MVNYLNWLVIYTIVAFYGDILSALGISTRQMRKVIFPEVKGTNIVEGDVYFLEVQNSLGSWERCYGVAYYDKKLKDGVWMCNDSCDGKLGFSGWIKAVEHIGNAYDNPALAKQYQISGWKDVCKS